jgi:hypothetical protein
MVGDIVRKDLDFTWKKLTVCPAESQTDINIFKTLQYIMFMAGVDPSKVHFDVYEAFQFDIFVTNSDLFRADLSQ